MDQKLPDFSVREKVALVTGASSGLGMHFARVLATGGAKVVIGARRVEKLAVLSDEISAGGGTAMAVALDVRDRTSVENAFRSAEREFGTVSLLINNAGVSGAGPLLSTSEETWDAVMDTNLKAVWQVARFAARRMEEASVSGSIVNIASILAYGAGASLGPYMAAKAAVVQLTHAMALEWASLNIRVNALAPGYFPTEMTAEFFDSEQGRRMMKTIPQRRFGNLNELNGPLLLLASDASSFMTGSVIVVDGGQLCRSM